MQYKDSAPNFAPSAEKTKKKLTRADFKKDVEEAVKKGIVKTKAPRAKRATKVKTGAYATWKVSELRAHLNQKKNALLTKAGFPEGKLPRSKVAMIALCKRLKRKRW